MYDGQAMNLTEFYVSLRRRFDATDLNYEPTRNSPRGALERVTCHPKAVRYVDQILFHINPWEGTIEHDPSVPLDRVRVTWLTPGRQRKSLELALG